MREQRSMASHGQRPILVIGVVTGKYTPESRIA